MLACIIIISKPSCLDGRGEQGVKTDRRDGRWMDDVLTLPKQCTSNTLYCHVFSVICNCSGGHHSQLVLFIIITVGAHENRYKLIAHAIILDVMCNG